MPAISSAKARLPQKSWVGEPGLHRAGDDEEDRVVDDLHHGDREGVRSERDRQGRPRGWRAPTEEVGRPRERITEEEGQRDCEDNRLEVAPAERRADHDTENLADRAPGQAVRR